MAAGLGLTQRRRPLTIAQDTRDDRGRVIAIAHSAGLIPGRANVSPHIAAT